MIVICEECGKKYQIDPAKIRGKQARFTCKSCGNPVTVNKAEEAPAAVEPVAAPSSAPEAGFQRQAAGAPATAPEPPTAEDRKEGKKEKKARQVSTPKRLGLRAKMMILFFLIPILCVAAAGWLYIQQLQDLSTLITAQSSDMVNEMAEEQVSEIAQAVAAECSTYIKAHPMLAKGQYNETPEFRDVAVQKVGETGYTALYELPGTDGVWRTWAHVNPKIIGIDMASLKKPLGKSFAGFWRVYTGVKKDKVSEGYYTWQDEDGKFRDKFMVCAPVEGSPYVIAATTYLDEFTRPVQRMIQQAKKQTRRTRNILLGIVGGTLVLIGVLVSIYGHRVTQRIKHLTEAAERISVGELDAEIQDTSGDEIGNLGEAISRMQDSIRLSLERLRKRR